MEQSHTISKLISQIYRAATDAALLRSALDAIAAEIGADLGALAIGELASSEVHFMVASTLPQDGQPGFDCSHTLSPVIREVIRHEADRIYNHAELRLNGTLVSNGIGLPYDLERGFCAHFRVKKSSFGFLSFCRNRDREAFDNKQRETLKLLLPHIKQAFEINHYLDEITLLNDVTQERYRQFSIGIVLLNDTSRVVYSNPVAKRLLQQPGGLSTHNGHLYSDDSTETSKLNSLIKRCIQTAGIKGARNDGFVSVSRESQHKPPLSLSVSSYANKLDARTLSASSGRALVVIFDSERRQVTQEHILERLYDLTTAEAALATHLADGKTLAQLALDNAVSRETLRSQLKRVFHKTHTKRQSELVKLVLTGPGSLVI